MTEKFFRGLGEFVVPVVLGGADYSTVAPAKSYISVQNFTSPRQLAEYLDWLVSNPAEYLSYFWWKPHYRVVEDVDPKTPHALPASFPCKLCVGSIAKDNKFVPKRLGNPPSLNIVPGLFEQRCEAGLCDGPGAGVAGGGAVRAQLHLPLQQGQGDLVPGPQNIPAGAPQTEQN